MLSRTQGVRRTSSAYDLVKRAQLVLRSSLCAVLSLAACQPAPKPQAASKTAVAHQPQSPNPAAYPVHFQTWLTAHPDETIQFEALKAYLTLEGVADILPLWQLVQAETIDAAAKCEIAGFAVPPQELWPTMVPTLRLVQQEIIPLLGPVKVLSSFRTNEANKCSLGAPQSPHKRYSALDLAMVNPMPQKEMFAKLCKHWDALSPRWGYGLGAYYVRSYPAYNEEGRFHVDTLGRRTWGHSYGAYTSHCRELGYISVKSPAEIKAEEEAKLKAELDALAKVEADEKAKLSAEIFAKAKAKEDARLKTEAAAKAAKTKAEVDASIVKIMVPTQAPLEAKGEATAGTVEKATPKS